jgi:hypothetical protein
MSAVTSERFEKLWEKGHWLSNCEKAFASQKQKEEWNDLQKMSVMKALENEVKRPELGNLGWVEHIAKALEKPSKILVQRQNLRDAIQEIVLLWLQQGQLVGIGFEPPRTLSKSPVSLPKEFWFGKVEWEKNAIHFQGLHFVEIRVQTLDNLRGSLPSPQAKRSQGRPPFELEMKRCLEHLVLCNEIDITQTIVSHFPKMRTYLNLFEPDLPKAANDISDVTLRKYLAPVFNNLKSKSKPSHDH